MEKKLKVIIDSIKMETSAVKSFNLVSADGNSLPAFSGGAHIKIFLPTSTLIRHYSLISSPDDSRSYKIAVAHAANSKGGSAYLHRQAREKDILEISYPKNHFPLSYRAKHHVFYAAGIGITPFLSMMADLRSRGKPFELHYAAKSEDKCAFYSFLLEYYSKETRFYFSGKGQRLKGEGLSDHRIGTHVYFCGPDSFISTHIQMCKDIGYPASSIHSEHFSPPIIRASSSFIAELSNGMSISVPADKSLLDSLHEAGIEIPYSCKVGKCGTCELRVLEGEIVHLDTFLTEDEKNAQDVIVSCVSRSITRLRIDLDKQ
ncbi:PDR/VanB family oxidoreductase [Bacillus haimaensis]|uniref:PDR/VanB family oxidoreductase n=1 Tax=Bacillus haimaensis TaxID=3160967 RepID=UPI003AA97EB2